jgi:hypothetical protein
LREEVTSGESEVADEFKTDPELLAIRDIFSKVKASHKVRTFTIYGKKGLFYT